MQLIDKSGVRTWCAAHKRLHYTKTCPVCRRLEPVSMRTLRKSGRLAAIEAWNTAGLQRRVTA